MSESFELTTRFDPVAHPLPWRIVETRVAVSVVDCTGCEIMSGDIDDRAFFDFIVRAVNRCEPAA